MVHQPISGDEVRIHRIANLFMNGSVLRVLSVLLGDVQPQVPAKFRIRCGSLTFCLPLNWYAHPIFPCSFCWLQFANWICQREMLESSVTQTLTSMNIATSDDIVRLAERLTNIEMRLDDMEAKLDESLRPRDT